MKEYGKVLHQIEEFYHHINNKNVVNVIKRMIKIINNNI